MKVLQLVKTSIGAAWALRQMRELAKLGVEVHVAMPVDGPLIEEYKASGVIVHPIKYSLVHIIDSCKQLCQIVKTVNPDIIHSHFVLTTIIMRIALCSDKRPRIFQVPGPLHLESFLFRKIDLWTAQKNDIWVGSCSWTNECYASNGIPREKIFLSYYGGDIVYKKSSVHGKIRKELNLPNNAILIGMVAYMYAPKYYLGQTRGLKGHEDFIDAITIVSEKYPNVYGVCIGGPWGKAKRYGHKVREYAKHKTNHVYFLGTRTDIPDLYADLFCVVHPSHSENLGGAGESLALGVPTIATKVGGFPDIVIDKVTGLLVPPKNPDFLAQTIIECIESKYDLLELANKGENLVRNMLDVKNTASSIREIYNKILS
ncbi:glycosyltransferase [Phocaeicola sp.]